MAGSGVKGDFASLDRFAKRLGIVASDSAMRQLSEAMAEETIELIQQGFEKQQSPEGDRWAPKVFPDGRRILVGKTARLSRGWHRKSASSKGFTVAPSVQYAKYQQEGTGIYGPRGQRIKPKRAKALSFEAGGSKLAFHSVKGSPARRMIPQKGRLPPVWRRALLATAKEFLRDSLTGK